MKISITGIGNEDVETVGREIAALFESLDVAVKIDFPPRISDEEHEARVLALWDQEITIEIKKALSAST